MALSKEEIIEIPSKRPRIESENGVKGLIYVFRFDYNPERDINSILKDPRRFTEEQSYIIRRFFANQMPNNPVLYRRHINGIDYISKKSPMKKLLKIVEKINLDSEKEATPENIIQICDFSQQDEDEMGFYVGRLKTEIKLALPNRLSQRRGFFTPILHSAKICLFVPKKIDLEFFDAIMDADLGPETIHKHKELLHVAGKPIILQPEQLDQVYCSPFRMEIKMVI